jgi:SAM-dependent MidA family methyltransferase
LSKLTEIIAERVHSKGIISFAEFMELALYCPEHGFYEKKKDTVGRGGHFYTSVSVGSLLGKLLAFRFAKWLQQLNPHSDSTLSLVELGAHDGQLACDILGWLRTNVPCQLKMTEYLIVEPSRRRREWQQEKLRPFGASVRWVDRLPDEIQGIIFSNELLDAMPVRRLEWNAILRQWMEWGVICRKDAFTWKLMELPSPPRLETILASELEDVLPDKFAWEVSEDALSIWRESARNLKKGYLVAFDYGFRELDLLERSRPGGTLRSYHEHSVSLDVLDKPGDQDITYSVNFDAICRAGENEGLFTRAMSSQSQFLSHALKEAYESTEWTPTGDEATQFQTLSHPDHLGSSFQALIQSRDAVG